MAAAHVYKHPGADAREALTELLLALRNVYRGAADNTEFVLVSFD